MAEVTMPRLSDTMEEGTIASWLKQPGEQISKGEVIAQIETDKATMDLTAFEAGTLEEILAPEGATVAIGQPVARIGNGTAKPATAPTGGTAPPAAAAGSAPSETADTAPSETADTAPSETADGAPSETADSAPSETAGGAQSEAAGTTEPGSDTSPGSGTSLRSDGALASDASPRSDGAPASETASGSEVSAGSDGPLAAAAAAGDSDTDAGAGGQKEAGGRPADARDAGGNNGSDGKVRASPMARHLAAEHGLDLSRLTGSGPQGRVIRADIEAALDSGQAVGSSNAPTAAPASSQSDRPVTSPESSRPDMPMATPEASLPDGSTASPERGLQRPAAGAGSFAASSADPDDERVSLSQMRRTIARRMAESTSTVPHFFLTTTVDATELVNLRKQVLGQIADAGVKITFGDLVVKAAALALRRVPDVNVSFAGDSLIRHKRIHVGIAVATDRGLIVPVLRDADQKSLGEINRQTSDLAERARTGKLQPSEYSGGTFTISNLGMFGVEQFNAVINPPEAAILAVGALIRQPAEVDGQIALRDHLKLTLSVDHRALDGATGARYLQAIKQLLEKPMLLLV